MHIDAVLLNGMYINKKTKGDVLIGKKPQTRYLGTSSLKFILATKTTDTINILHVRARSNGHRKNM
jgi:hypothetical protein